MRKKLELNNANNLVEWFSRTAKKYPERISVVDKNTELTYKVLDSLSD